MLSPCERKPRTALLHFYEFYRDTLKASLLTFKLSEYLKGKDRHSRSFTFRKNKKLEDFIRSMFLPIFHVRTFFFARQNIELSEK